MERETTVSRSIASLHPATPKPDSSNPTQFRRALEVGGKNQAMLIPYLGLLPI